MGRMQSFRGSPSGDEPMMFSTEAAPAATEPAAAMMEMGSLGASARARGASVFSVGSASAGASARGGAAPQAAPAVRIRRPSEAMHTNEEAFEEVIRSEMRRDFRNMVTVGGEGGCACVRASSVSVACAGVCWRACGIVSCMWQSA